MFFQAEDGIRDLVRSRGLGDVYKRQYPKCIFCHSRLACGTVAFGECDTPEPALQLLPMFPQDLVSPVSYTHLRAHETVLDLVCRLLLEKKKNPIPDTYLHYTNAPKYQHQPTNHISATYTSQNHKLIYHTITRIHK